MHLRRLVQGLILTLILLMIPALVSAQESPTIFISQPDSANFPEVTFNLRAVGSDNQAMTTLTSANLALYEGDQPVEGFTLTPAENAPVVFVYVIDLGRYANYGSLGLDRFRQSLTTLVDGGYFRDGVDKVAILARANNGSVDGTSVLLDATQDGAEFTAYVNSATFAPSSGGTRALDALTTAQERIPEWANPSTSAAVVIFVSPFVDQPAPTEALPAAQQLASELNGKQIPVYTLHTHLSGQLPEPLQALSSMTGGQYLRLQAQGDQSAALTQFYESMNGVRGFFTVAYRSPSSASGARRVVVAAAGSPATSPLAETSYEVTLQPPAVAIVSPGATSEFTIPRDPEAPPASLPIQVQVQSWPDGHPREIRSAEILVNGQPSGAAQPVSGETFQVSWTPTAEMAEAEAPVTVAVRVTDELGLTADTAPVNVTVIEEKGGFLGGSGLLIGLGVLGLLVVLAAAGVGGFLFLRSRKPQAASRGAAAPSRMGGFAPAGGASHTVVASEEDEERAARVREAKIQVEEGPEHLVGRAIPLPKGVFRLGRDPEQVDLAFYSDTKSSISGMHCTIAYITRQYLLRDNHSTNGTRLNGERIDPDQTYELADGDEIVLGSLPLKGVRLIFVADTAGGGARRKPKPDRGATRVDADDIEDSIGSTRVEVDGDDADDWTEEPRRRSSGGSSDDDWQKELG